MAKRKTGKAPRAARSAGKRTAARRPSAKRPSSRKAAGRKKPPARKSAPKASASKRPVKTAKKPARKSAAGRGTIPKIAGKTPRLERTRRTLEETVEGPPSSLDLDRNASAARSGRAELAEKQREHQNMTDFAGGDPDVDVEDAYFTGEEAPGGDNPTPDQDIVDDIGKALGLEYADNEELKSSDKVVERDKHRWELDPASSEDYKERK
jgi:uncharacterized protein DUF6335